MKKFLTAIFLSVTILFTGSGIIEGGGKAPSFALFNLNGKLTTLSRLLQDGNLILSFWASYCKPCIREMPQLVEMEKKYKGTNNVHLVMVNIDKEGKDVALPILQNLKVESECLFDVYQVAAKRFIPNLKVPAIFLIDKQSNIIFSAVGEKPGNLENLEKAIKRLK
jgi:cytochrome c biogenesis protein CcmG, thiol:disulfide interchange protein DsbE